MAKVLILGKKSYNFKNEGDGKTVSGTKIHYISTDDDDEDTKGFIPLVSTVSLKMGTKIESVPAIYDIEMGLKSGKNGQAKLDIVNISYLEEYSLIF